MSAEYICINLISSRIYDAFDQKTRNISSVFNVFMFITLQFESDFFLFDRLSRFTFQIVLLY